MFLPCHAVVPLSAQPPAVASGVHRLLRKAALNTPRKERCPEQVCRPRTEPGGHADTCVSLPVLSFCFLLCVSQETWREVPHLAVRPGALPPRPARGPGVCVCLGAKLSLIESGDVAQLDLSFCVSVALLSAKVFNQEIQAFT